MHRVWLACALGLLLLQGCTRTPPAAPVSWQQHSTSMAALEHWYLEGKLGYRTAADAGTARLSWRQAPQWAEVSLSGPFGAGSAHIRTDPEGAVLRQPGAAELRAASGEALSRELLGWELPVSELRDWVRGIPFRGAPVEAMHFDALGRLERLQQDGWELAFSDYRDTDAGFLPGRIDADDGHVRIRLVIKSWRLDLS